MPNKGQKRLYIRKINKMYIFCYVRCDCSGAVQLTRVGHAVGLLRCEPCCCRRAMTTVSLQVVPVSTNFLHRRQMSSFVESGWASTVLSTRWSHALWQCHILPLWNVKWANRQTEAAAANHGHFYVAPLEAVRRDKASFKNITWMNTMNHETTTWQ